MISKKHIKRREFIKMGGGALTAALTFPTILPAKVFAQKGTNAPNNKIVVGCIGVGGMGMGNMRGFLEKKEVQVVAVCDVDRNHRNKAKSKVDNAYSSNDCETYNDYRDLLARKDIDAVMIAAPDHWHGLMAVDAARSGKDIYGEKPLAYTIAEGRAIVDAVERYGWIWQTGSWQRSLRHFRFGAELVRNGRIGKVHTVRVGLPTGNNIVKGGFQVSEPPEELDYNMWLGPAPWRPYSINRCHFNFRWISDYSGGQLTDWAGHHCDIANWGMDTELSAPISIAGEAEYPLSKDGLFDTPGRYYFECDYEEGFKMIVADEQQQPKGMGAHFIGDEGWVHVTRGNRIDAHPKSLLKSVIEPNEIHLYKSENHIQNFLDCVRSRSKTITPADVAHHSIMIGHLGGIAMKLKRRVNWDKANERFIDDPQANRLLSRPMRSPWQL